MGSKRILIVILVASPGVIAILTGIFIRIVTNNRNRSCLRKVIGNVVEHKFQGGSKMFPVVEFEVEGKKYLTKKKFNLVKSIKIGRLTPIKEEVYEDDKGNLCIKTGPISNYKKLSEKLWPIGKELWVYYNPQNPKINYVDRPITNNFLSLIFVIIGTLTILLALVLCFII